MITYAVKVSQDITFYLHFYPEFSTKGFNFDKIVHFIIQDYVRMSAYYLKYEGLLFQSFQSLFRSHLKKK